MKKIALLLALLASLLTGCSVSEALPVEKKTVIFPIDKTLAFPIGDLGIDHDIYQYFTRNGWKVVEEADETSSPTHRPTRFAIKYKIGWVDKSFTLDDLYTGHIAMVELSSGSIILAVRFKRLTQSEIFDLFKEQVEQNIVIRTPQSLTRL